MMEYKTNCPGMAPLRSVAALIPLIFGNAAGAQLLGDQIELITDTADRICNVVTATGSASSMDVQGEVKAELSGLASRLANAGISGSGKLAEERYQNVLREDLAGVLRDNAACKLKVFETLSSKILGSVEEPVLNIAGRWRDNWGIIYTIAQEGNAFRYSASGPSCHGSFVQSLGRGTIKGREVESSYNSSLPSGGRCSGTVFANGTEISSSCNDTICGSFSASLIKQ